MSEEIKQFYKSRQSRIECYEHDNDLKSKLLHYLTDKDYEYNFDYLGLPIIQFPQDMVAVQELIWEVQPDLIIETGVARGGSLIQSASILAMLDMKDAVEQGSMLDPSKPSRKVIGIDIDIRQHNREKIEAHHLSSYIDLIEDSSISDASLQLIKSKASSFKSVMVFLDSDHSHEHVLEELNLYSELVTSGSYIVAFDSVVDDLDERFNEGKSWTKSRNPKTAVFEFLESNTNFSIDKMVDSKIFFSVAPSGYLKKS
jgi:cephalosporin hydroxylase